MDDIMLFKEMYQKRNYKELYGLFKKDESLVKRLHNSYEDKEIADASILWIFSEFLIKGMKEEANQFHQAVKQYLPLRENLDGILETTQWAHNALNRPLSQH